MNYLSLGTRFPIIQMYMAFGPLISFTHIRAEICWNKKSNRIYNLNFTGKEKGKGRDYTKCQPPREGLQAEIAPSLKNESPMVPDVAPEERQSLQGDRKVASNLCP